MSSYILVKKKRWESGILPEIAIKEQVSFNIKNIPFKYPKGPFKYYVIKEVGGWGQKMAILDDLQYCKSSKGWVSGPKKVKNMMT